MTKMNLYERACLVLLVFTAMAGVSSAQTFTTLHSFDGSDGATPTFPSRKIPEGSSMPVRIDSVSSFETLREVCSLKRQAKLRSKDANNRPAKP